MTLLNDIVPAAAQPHALLADEPALTPAALADLHHALHGTRAAAAAAADAAHPENASEALIAAAAAEHGSARFSHTRGLRWLRLAFRAAGAVSTGAQAQLGYRVLSTPPRFARPLREQRVLAAAQPFTVPVRDRALRAWRWGRGPTVLLAHCWGGRGSQLAEFVEALQLHGLSPVVFDAPAHGDSPGRRTDMIEMAESIAAVARACGPLQGVIGHSLGGAASLLATCDYGLETPRLVSIGAFSHCIWFTEAFGRLVGMSPAAVAAMRALLSRRYSHRVDWSRLGITEALRATGAHTRALLVHDLDDREVPFAHALALHRARPQAELMATRGLGHRRVLRDASVILRAAAFVRG
jgi:hypothetical protein